MANVMPRRRKDGSIVYRVRVRSLGICVSRTFPSLHEAERYAEGLERDLSGRAPAELETVAGLIDRYAPTAPDSGGERLRYWREKIGHLRLTRSDPGRGPGTPRQPREGTAPGLQLPHAEATLPVHGPQVPPRP